MIWLCTPVLRRAALPWTMFSLVLCFRYRYVTSALSRTLWSAQERFEEFWSVVTALYLHKSACRLRTRIRGTTHERAYSPSTLATPVCEPHHPSILVHGAHSKVYSTLFDQHEIHPRIATMAPQQHRAFQDMFKNMRATPLSPMTTTTQEPHRHTTEPPSFWSTVDSPEAPAMTAITMAIGLSCRY